MIPKMLDAADSKETLQISGSDASKEQSGAQCNTAGVATEPSSASYQTEATATEHCSSYACVRVAHPVIELTSRYVAVMILTVTKYAIRSGKELVKRSFIATGNEENEFGKVVRIREMPFRSLTMDVLQCTI